MTITETDIKIVASVVGLILTGLAIIVRQDRRIEAKADKAEMLAALDRKASKQEVIDHGVALSEHRESIAVTRTEMVGLRETLTGLREDFRALSSKIERWMERE